MPSARRENGQQYKTEPMSTTTSAINTTTAVVHPTAVLGEHVELGPGVTIREFVVIADDVRIGAGTTVEAHVSIGRHSEIGADCLLDVHSTVREHCRLGDRVVLGAGSTVGSDGFGFATSEGVHHKIPHAGRVEIEHDVRIGANVTIDRATMGVTRLRQGCVVQNLAQVAHNVEVGEETVIEFQAGIAGSTKIGAGVRLGKKSGVLGHSSIGDRASVADCSGALKAVKAGEHVAGLPASDLDTHAAIETAVRDLPAWLHELKALRHRIAELEAMLAHPSSIGKGA